MTQRIVKQLKSEVSKKISVYQEGEVKVFVQKGNLAEAKSQAIILTFFEGQKKLAGAALQIDQKCNGLISELIKNRDFEAKLSQISVIYTKDLLPAKRITLLGLGKSTEVDLDKIRGAFAKVMQHLRSLNIKEAVTSIDWKMISETKEKITQALVEGALLGLYQYNPYKTVGREDLKEMEQLNIICEGNDLNLIEKEVKKTQMITEAVYFTRDLVSAPSNEMTPSIMAKKAQRIGKRKNVVCKVLDKKKMKELGMNSLLGVASGSNEEPQFIILEYSGGKKSEAPIVLIGKGLTFDSGGISIKPSEKMD